LLAGMMFGFSGHFLKILLSNIERQMKRAKPLPRKTKTFSVTVPAELVPQIRRRCRETQRSVSSYLSWLIGKG
jgi:hypothetical protein